MGLLVLNLLLNDLHLLEAKINIICTFYISFLPDPCYLVRGYHCEVGFFSLKIGEMDKVTALKENVNPFVLGLASLLCVAIMFCNLVLLF
jgi:hypothetical protein